MSDETNKELVRRYFEEVLSKRDTALVDELFSSDFVYHYTGAPANLAPGLKGFKQLVTDYLAGFTNLRFTIDNQTSEGDKVVTNLTAHASNIGAMRTAPEISSTPTSTSSSPSATTPEATPVTAEPTSFAGKSTDRIVDGKIAESWVEFDVPAEEQELGFTPTEGGSKQ